MVKEKVAIVKCKSYKQEEVDKAIKRILKLLDFPVHKHKKIIRKIREVKNGVKKRGN